MPGENICKFYAITLDATNEEVATMPRLLVALCGDAAALQAQDWSLKDDAHKEDLMQTISQQFEGRWTQLLEIIDRSLDKAVQSGCHNIEKRETTNASTKWACVGDHLVSAAIDLRKAQACIIERYGMLPNNCPTIAAMQHLHDTMCRIGGSNYPGGKFEHLFYNEGERRPRIMHTPTGMVSDGTIPGIPKCKHAWKTACIQHLEVVKSTVTEQTASAESGGNVVNEIERLIRLFEND